MFFRSAIRRAGPVRTRQVKSDGAGGIYDCRARGHVRPACRNGKRYLCGVCVTIINRIRRVVKIENCRPKIASAHFRDFEG